jgi:MHS family shikimate/dehydroshikimate transporter-like MFS transporter
MTGSVVVALVAFPFFAALETRSFALVLVAAIVIINISHDLNDAVESSCFSELFGPGCRYTGTAMGHQLGAAHGGFAPLIAGSLSAAAGRSWVPVAAYVAVSCLISTACVLASRETVHRRVARQRERPSSGAALSPALAEGRCSIA